MIVMHSCFMHPSKPHKFGCSSLRNDQIIPKENQLSQMDGSPFQTSIQKLVWKRVQIISVLTIWVKFSSISIPHESMVYSSNRQKSNTKTPLQLGLHFKWGNITITGLNQFQNLPGCLVLVLGSEFESFPSTQNQRHHSTPPEAEKDIKQLHMRVSHKFWPAVRRIRIPSLFIHIQ